jgi:glycosyltransferase involved in cell wall biosynthesis
MKPLITALVDTYNQERYIEQALVSVLEQGLSPAELEIVVVDDGSTDNTSSIIQIFLPRVKYLRGKNGAKRQRSM